MKYALPLALWFGLVIGLSELCQAQERFGLHLQGRHKTTRIPFELHSNLIIVPMKVNDSDTLRFILDSGVSTILITDPKVPAVRHMKPVRRVHISGAGEGSDLSATVMVGNRIQMGYMKGFNQNIVVLDHDILQISEYVGIPVHGIFGYELFNQFVVTIDFSRKELILEEPSHYRYKAKKGDQFPITIEDAKPYLNAVALVDKKRTVPIKVVIDTGAGHALSLDVNSRNQIPLPNKVIRTQLGRGLNGIINGSLGRVEKIQIGHLELNNIIASFPDSLAYGMKLSKTIDRQGNIGCELLRRFKVTFNYPQRYIVLKPVRRRIREAFEHNMSGIDIVARGSHFDEFMIERVELNSPASLAGLQAGDQLISVDGEFCRSITMSDLYKIFQRGEGKEIIMAIRRKGELLVTTLTLKRII
ncbi:aspartyl protease family protein [Siphonobacter sp. SORGH_AS_1065]|uniref:aspartyl protease family protein n=1 Tax=Siphonobacter sp. SORGH_AS_1065 TaxID=3041795 RepID=UPI0027826FBA|nr:aspartyl protease family protein [Siphonobacter sp. SORGH_AS_1065]MDQ1086255.1 membrane-associated protease RseP (regulator of RpoE activity) [Siphonobacter sp. SORGH_AS_1065]